MELDELKKIVDVTLKKLEDEGVVKKSKGKYSLTKKTPKKTWYGYRLI